MPKSSTFYYAKMFQVPTNLTAKRHILKYQIVLPTVNTANIHHTVVYQCSDSYTGVPFMIPGNSETNWVKGAYCPIGPIGLGLTSVYNYIFK